MTRPIIVGLDGSPESRAAADWAGREARRREAPVRLVYAWTRPPQPTGGPRADGADEAGDEPARGLLEETQADLTSHHPGVAVSTERISQEPVPALVARSEGAEMVVLGSRGHGAALGFLLGSVGLRVLAQAKAPVVLVRSPSDAAGAPDPEEVVVGVQDTAESAGPVLEFAFATAAARRAPLRAVRAWSLPPVFAYSPQSLRLLDEAGGLEPYERGALAEAVRPWREKFPDVAVTEHVEIGSAAEVLLGSAARAGLLVVGRATHRPPLVPYVGHVAHAALHHARCPVAVVPHG
ncbi:universal stress protein [Streptomyces sp. LX-29]|uniref:universal stress protein n=1 Tax=Streptomyces sp. LX-29 TaxID=2900152 RepID=UPI00240D162A|nr:universal stress protein [Streptomyces sp. LX-29]WFB06115.1 universal stress protein [Streptomyces sp. LX-29]